MPVVIGLDASRCREVPARRGGRRYAYLRDL
jgi:hypothetical protein